MAKDTTPKMEMRDWFAAFALAGDMARGPSSTMDNLAQRAYVMADEMLKCRAQTK